MLVLDRREGHSSCDQLTEGLAGSWGRREEITPVPDAVAEFLPYLRAIELSAWRRSGRELASQVRGAGFAYAHTARRSTCCLGEGRRNDRGLRSRPARRADGELGLDRRPFPGSEEATDVTLRSRDRDGRLPCSWTDEHRAK